MYVLNRGSKKFQLSMIYLEEINPKITDKIHVHRRSKIKSFGQYSIKSNKNVTFILLWSFDRYNAHPILTCPKKILATFTFYFLPNKLRTQKLFM